MASDYQIKNLDICKFMEGIITLSFVLNKEAHEFGQLLKKEKGYQVELIFVKELHEIPETDDPRFVVKDRGNGDADSITHSSQSKKDQNVVMQQMWN